MMSIANIEGATQGAGDDDYGDNSSLASDLLHRRAAEGAQQQHSSLLVSGGLHLEAVIVAAAQKTTEEGTEPVPLILNAILPAAAAQDMIIAKDDYGDDSNLASDLLRHRAAEGAQQGLHLEEGTEPAPRRILNAAAQDKIIGKLDQRLDHADFKIKVKEVSPDFVFPESLKPGWPTTTQAGTEGPSPTTTLTRASPPISPWASSAGAMHVTPVPFGTVFPEPPTTQTGTEGPSPTTIQARASPLDPLLVILDGGVLAVVAAAKWVRFIKAQRRSFLRERRSFLRERRSFLLELSQLCAAADLALEGEILPVSAEEAEQQRAELEELVANGLELGKRKTLGAAWRRGEESRQLETYAQKLQQGLAKVKRAAKELNVMAEIEQLLDRLRDMPAAGGGGGAPDDRNEIDDGDIGVIPQRDRLSTRAASLLSDSDNGGNTRCLFREELTRWCRRLTVREGEVTELFQRGLNTWNLDEAHKAFKQLRLLQRPEIVQNNQEKWDSVRDLRWEIEGDLQNAVSLARNGDPSSLLSACVHAETFSCKGLKVYETAKSLLNKAREDQLQIVARTILINRFNVHVDLAWRPAMLLRDGPVEERVVDGGAGLLMGAGGGGSGVATLALPSAGGVLAGAVEGGEMLEQQAGLQMAREQFTTREWELDSRHSEHETAYRMQASNRRDTRIAEFTRRADERARNAQLANQHEESTAIDRERMQGEQAHRMRQEEDGERRERQARDHGFWRALSMFEFFLAPAVAAYNKGLTPEGILDDAWKVLVAECAPGGIGNGVPLEGGTTGALEGCNAGGAADGSENALWWASSYAGSTAGAVVRAGYSSGGWLLEKTLGLVIPDVLCEARAVLSLVWSLFVLALVSRMVKGVLGSGRVGDVALCGLLVAWVWVQFQGWVQRTMLELLLLLAPAPVLVMFYGYVLEYVEHHHEPDGRWRMWGWDTRPVWFRVLPFIMSSALACFLGVRAS